MNPVLGILVIVGVVLAAVKAAKGKENVDPRIAKAILDADAGKATKAQLEEAIKLALAAGLNETADYLKKALARLGQGKPKPVDTSSPIKEASTAQWLQFSARMKQGSTGTKTPTGLLGMFLFDVRRLEDLGYVTDTTEFKTGEGKRGFKGVFKAPLTEEKFLGDGDLQFKAFAESMTDYRKNILSKNSDAIGTTHDGEKATLSGLLGVADAAGLKGMRSWLSNDDDKKNFPNTTKQFHTTNGIF